MKHARTLLIIGLWMAFTPFIGIPFRWHKTIFLVSGLIIIFLAFRTYIHLKKSKQGPKQTPETHQSKTTPTIQEEISIPESVQPRLKLEDSPSIKAETKTPATSKETKSLSPSRTTKKEPAQKNEEPPKQKNTESKQSDLKPSRKLLTIAAVMLGREFQKALEVERTTPRIRITKPKVSFKDIPIAAEIEEPPEEQVIETISIEDEEIEIIVDEEIEKPVESFEVDTEASFVHHPDSPDEDTAEESKDIDQTEREEGEEGPEYATANSENLYIEEEEDDSSQLFSKDRDLGLTSNLLSRLSDDFDDEEELED